MEDVRQQLLKVKQENHDLEKELRSKFLNRFREFPASDDWGSECYR